MNTSLNAANRRSWAWDRGWSTYSTQVTLGSAQFPASARDLLVLDAPLMQAYGSRHSRALPGCTDGARRSDQARTGQHSELSSRSKPGLLCRRRTAAAGFGFGMLRKPVHIIPRLKVSENAGQY